MAVISDIGGTSQNSFSINGKITLFQGDEIPDDLMGNNGDVYFKSEGLIYVKRNGTWLTNDPEDIKWIPDPRLHRNTLLYSNGENYEHTKITYNDNPNDPYQLELFQTPNGSSSTTSMIVPNLGLLNDPSKDTNILHKSGDETKVDILSLKNKNGLRGNNNISSHQLNFLDKNDNTTGSLKNILNTSNESSVENNTVITQLLAKSSNNESKINLIAKSDGTKYATAPTPSDSAESNELITAEWAKQNISGKKLGEIIWSHIPLNDSGLLALNGQRITRNEYPEFYNKINNLRNYTNLITITSETGITINRTKSNCGKFYINTSQQYLWLPDFSDIMCLSPTVNNSLLGTYLQPGLPNITGSIGNTDEDGLQPSGAFYKNGTSGRLENAKGEPDPNVYMDASRSSPIYGKSNTVQPESVKSFVYIVVATNIKGDSGSINVQELINEINTYKNLVIELNNYVDQALNNKIGFPDYTHPKTYLSIGHDGIIRDLEFTTTKNGILYIQYTRTDTGGGNFYVSMNGIRINTWPANDYNHSIIDYSIKSNVLVNLHCDGCRLQQVIFYPYI